MAKARIAAAAGELQQAMDHLRLLIDGQPEFVDGGRLLGRLYFDTGDAEAAASIFSELILRDPRDGATHFELSRVLASRGQVDEALDHLERARALGMTDFKSLGSDPSFRMLANHPRLTALERTWTDDTQREPDDG